eukprot:jgi/Phyca11/102684/e_gw1.7.736.1
MPKRVAWRELAINVSPDEVGTIREGLKSHKILKSEPGTCSLCPGTGHKMRYRLLACTSSFCETGATTCSWRGKLLVCLSTGRSSMYEFGEHFTLAASPKRLKLTDAQKTYCKALAEERLKPMRIRHALSKKFNVSLDNLPSLTTVQNYVNNFSRTQLDNHDRTVDIRKWVHERAYTGSESMTEPFSFSWNLDDNGKPTVGNGSDEKPFLVGISTKSLMMRLAIPPDTFILHIDATYKLNRLDYPVVVVGISDRSRGFHLVALFIVSQEIQEMYERVLLALSRQFTWIAGYHLSIENAMADADQAQYNALRSVFGTNPRYQFLMGFFHVMKNVHKVLKGFHSHVYASIVEDIYDLHFANNQSEFLEMREQILQKWMAQPTLVKFGIYMRDQWLFGRFCNWQLFSTPTGYATTNNPVETFNSPRPFLNVISPSATLIRRAKEMARENLLQIWIPHESQTTSQHSTVHVLSWPARRVHVNPTKRSEVGIAVSAQMGVNYARMEVWKQPLTGWPVNLQLQWCPCKFCFAFGTCVHVIHALRVTCLVDGEGKELLVSRRKPKNGPVGFGLPGGRGNRVGPALTY